MPREREGVHHQCEAEQVSRLAQATLAVCAVQVEPVLEGAVDTLGVTTPGVEAGEVRIGAGDRTQVFGAVELLLRILIVAVEANGNLDLLELDGKTVLGRVSQVGAGDRGSLAG
jgi:hypothetical protein